MVTSSPHWARKWKHNPGAILSFLSSRPLNSTSTFFLRSVYLFSLFHGHYGDPVEAQLRVKTYERICTTSITPLGWNIVRLLREKVRWKYDDRMQAVSPQSCQPTYVPCQHHCHTFHEEESRRSNVSGIFFVRRLSTFSIVERNSFASKTTFSILQPKTYLSRVKILSFDCQRDSGAFRVRTIDR